MATEVIQKANRSRWARVRSALWQEFCHVLPPTIFFFVGFNLILFTKRLILAEYLVQFSGFFIATTSALVVGKVVLVADKLPYLRRFDYAPLIQPILFKTVVYTLLVFVVRLIERLVHYLIEGGTIGGGAFLNHLVGTFSWHQFIAAQMWIFVLFFIYVTANEIGNLIGDGELFKLFFTRRSSEFKSTRRMRIRLLVALSRLIDAHSVEVLSDPKTQPHGELVAILRHLAERRQ
jgi:hypothetical protein